MFAKISLQDSITSVCFGGSRSSPGRNPKQLAFLFDSFSLGNAKEKEFQEKFSKRIRVEYATPCKEVPRGGPGVPGTAKGEAARRVVKR